MTKWPIVQVEHLNHYNGIENFLINLSKGVTRKTNEKYQQSLSEFHNEVEYINSLFN